jgi:hypothetical protein
MIPKLHLHIFDGLQTVWYLDIGQIERQIRVAINTAED